MIQPKRYVVLLAAIALCLAGCDSGKLDSACWYGPQPGEKRMKELKAEGVKTIINIRLNKLQGLEKLAHSEGLNYVSHPNRCFQTTAEETY